MKKILIAISIVSILAFGTIAFAQGMGGGSGGHMSGQGYGSGHMSGYGMTGPGGHMGTGNGGHMGQGYGGHMGDRTGPGYGTGQTDQKFLDDTADLRKELHNKRFTYNEASRNPDTTMGQLRNMEKEMFELEGKIYEKSPRTNRGYGTN